VNSQLNSDVVDVTMGRLIPSRRQPTDEELDLERDMEQGAPVRTRLAASRVRPSMTRGGAPGENAHMESFFHSLEADLVHGRTCQTVAGLRQQLCRYVHYYNYHRLHSSLNYQSPVDYERRAA
jgi:transposase InsO family protein